MRKRKAMLVRQRGVAVITALLLTTLAITIVASLFWQQQVQVRSIENQRLQLQKQWILRGALDWARLILREDAKASQTDNLDEPWAVPLEETRLDQYVENGRTDAEASDAALSGTIVDAQSRFNLTNLCINGEINQREVTVFGKLLSNLQLNPSLAQAAAELMASAQKKSGDAGVSGSQPMDIKQVDDFLAVPGVSPQIFNKIKDFIVVLPVATPININTASAEVLSAVVDTLSLSEAATVVNDRKRAYFRDIADFANRLTGKSSSIAQNEMSVSTSYFIVTGNVRLSRAVSQIQSLIERNVTSTKVIWIRET